MARCPQDDEAGSEREPGSRPGAGSGKRLILLAVVAAALAVVAAFQYLHKPGPPPLHERLRGDAHEAVEAVDQGIAGLGEPAKVELLLSYADDPSPNLRYAAVDALGDCKGPTVSDALLAAFEDSSSAVRQRAVETLHRVDPARGYSLLLTALRDDDDWIREAAALQLMSVLRDPQRDRRRAFPSLIAALDIHDPVVCRTAAHTLSRLTGKAWRIRLGMSDAEREAVVRKWRTWWAATGPAKGHELPRPVRPTRRDPGPDFSIRDLDGKTHTSQDLRGKVVVLHFYATWCGPCDAEMRGLAELDAAYAPRGVAMLGVVLPPHSATEVRRWCGERRVRFPQSLSSSEVTEAFGHIHEVPVTVLMDRAGLIRYRWEGERERGTFESALDRILSDG